MNLSHRGLTTFEPVYRLISEFFNDKQRPNIEDIDLSGNELKELIAVSKIVTRITTVSSLNVLENLNFASI